MIKSFSISSLAFTICFSLFAFMAFLIRSEHDSITDPVADPIIEVFQSKEMSKPKIRDHKLPEPPPKPVQMPKVAPITPDDSSSSVGFNIDLTEVKTIDTQPSFGSENLPSDGDARPVVRFDPSFPLQAARDGVEGWVQLLFDIDAIGGVTNVRVIAAEPKRTFDKAAKQALRKWKYRAKVVNGKAVSQRDLSVRLDFTLNK